MIKSLVSGLFLLLVTSQTVLAHGIHYEVQLISELQVNNQRQLSAIKMSWLYNQEASEDFLKGQTNLGILSKQLISDLQRFNFFTQLEVENKILLSGKAQDFVLKLLKEGDSSLLELTFTLPIKSKIDIKTLRQLKLNHADPTGMALFYYDKPQDIFLAEELKRNCSAELREKKEFAVGEFPQTVSINCQ